MTTSQNEKPALAVLLGATTCVAKCASRRELADGRTRRTDHSANAART